MPGTVTVACKHPPGLLLYREVEKTVPEPIFGGGFRDVKRFLRTGDPVKINGPAHPQDRAPHCAIIGGYAMTYGVDADFWADWMKLHGNDPIVREGIIMAMPKMADAEKEAKDNAGIRSGLERLDPNNLPREFTAGRNKIEAAVSA
jgi:hypothetical protein